MKVFKINSKKGIMLIIGILSTVLLILYHFLPAETDNSPVEYSLEAAEIMIGSIDLISDYCRENDINIDRIRDPSLSGLIGPEMSDITTTIGHLEAKRTTLDPGFASLVVELLTRAGVKRGDTIAIGCSGSFPALMIASLSAAEAMDLYPRVIISLGSSSFGANNPDFTLLDIYILLLKNGLVTNEPAAVSLGAEFDTGSGFEDDVLQKMKSKIRESGYLFIYEPELKSNVQMREDIYSLNGTARISAFINSGGSYANMGTSILSLNLHPGLVGQVSIPGEDSGGVIFSMLSNDIPVIHLLFIKGLVQKYNMEWDPVTYTAGNELLYGETKTGTSHIILSIGSITLFFLFLIWFSKLNNIISSSD